MPPMVRTGCATRSRDRRSSVFALRTEPPVVGMATLLTVAIDPRTGCSAFDARSWVVVGTVGGVTPAEPTDPCAAAIQHAVGARPTALTRAARLRSLVHLPHPVRDHQILVGDEFTEVRVVSSLVGRRAHVSAADPDAGRR